MIKIPLQNIIDKINNHNIVFFDPPWGGKSYKTHKLLKLHIGDNSIEDICRELFDSNSVRKNPEMIALKLPTNYDVPGLYKQMKDKKIYFYDLSKMFVIIIVND